jgi:16S rRNA C1402 (ribose-2'-O) methylase RsmI
LDGPLEKLCFEGFLLIGNTQKKQQPQRYQKGCCLFLIFYETTGPIGTTTLVPIDPVISKK